MNKQQGGFTLIELMVVVIIIAALAGMVLPRVIPASDEAKKNIAKGDMANISVGLKLYRLYNGAYPATLETLMDAEGQGPYLEKQPLDPWKHSYRYKFLSEDAVPPFDLWSAGPDGREGTGDDVKYGQ
ncbi:MAG: type II secretion system protein GspG [Lentisphaerae bacterium]|nr:type II secretion system protein GspG [Lentisphaerota bacterium]